ncbi:hypothetical protein C7B64_06580 [Merismopedia glauca CCAP 1448/3]|uniref:Uncharacterized protein n=1 Tax=Merismopedia glauca CCAP 1448/3 TaxID=1296344 RepID=A0A2T1C6V1_9CYAN|nr:hypothetical protein C7B64_06580 [Merismopedia glauca CCAP 1448/3]
MGRAGIEPATINGLFYRQLPPPIGEPTQIIRRDVAVLRLYRSKIQAELIVSGWENVLTVLATALSIAYKTFIELSMQ